MTDARDWQQWHTPYDDPGSSLSRRLAHIQRRVGDVLDAAPAGQLRILSMCAGRGRDLIEPLSVHPRRDDVRALLVERDPRSAEAARHVAREAGLSGVQVVTGDAARTSAYADVVPVDLALVCGVFGNVPDDDIRRTVHHLPELVRSGGTVIWTRHQEEPDLTPAIRGWFEAEGFTEVGWDVEDNFLYAVGTHVLDGPSRNFMPDVDLFRFYGDGSSAFG